MRMSRISLYPENCIFLGSTGVPAADAMAFISQMKGSHPDNFEGDRDFFPFELRYTAPFDKGFHELKRLQGTAAEAAGRRNEFKGYIIIDMSGWLTHHDEQYLNKALLFLIDMSDCWKYIFFIDNQNTKAAKQLAGKILSSFFCDHIPCSVKEIEKCSCKASVCELCKAQGIACSPAAKDFLQELLEQGFSESIIAAFFSEMSWRGCKKISMEQLTDLMNDRESVLRYMLTQKEYNRLLAILEKRKENWYGEKEAI